MPSKPNSTAKVIFGQLCADRIENGKGKRTVKEVAKLIPNTPASQFTRWKTGNWTYIPEDKLVRIVQAICPDDYRAQVELVLAYLTDLAPMQFRPTILMGQKDENEGQGLRPMGGPGSNWSDEMRLKFDAMADAYLKNEDFASMFDQLAAWARRVAKEKPTAARP